MKNTNFIAFLLLIIFLSVIAFGQTKNNCNDLRLGILDRQVCDDEIRWKDSHIIWILPKVFNSLNVPAGVSVKFSEAVQKDDLSDFTPESFTLRDILNKVITVQTQYFWKEENGVVNVYPLEDYSILNTIVKDFSVSNSTRGEAIGKLLETNEFKRYIKFKNLREEDTPIFGNMFFGPKKTFSLTLKNATVREILNEIVKHNGNSTWIYKEYESENEGIKKIVYSLS